MSTLAERHDPSEADEVARTGRLRKSYDYSKPRRNYPRSKTGCLSCRARKKKCDETTPRCLACCRRHLVCTWPDGRQTGPQSSSSPNSSEQASATIDQPLQGENTEQLLSVQDFRDSLREQWSLGKGAIFTSTSAHLLRHYLEHTAGLLSTAPLSKSPFVTLVVPLAYSDDLLMNVVLALSGTHLASKQTRMSLDQTGGNGMDTQYATAVHYQTTLSGLRSELEKFDYTNAASQVRILLVLLLLCYYEAISGNETRILLQHLHASGELIKRLLSQPLGGDINNDSLGFSIELYAYLSIVNSFSCHEIVRRQGQLYDAPLTCLEALNSYSTFGIMFSGCHGLFELIPQVTRLGVECLAMESLQQNHWFPRLRAHTYYEDLKERITNWTLPPLPTEQDQIMLAAEAIRHGLHVYLLTSVCGSQRPDAESQRAIQDHIEIIMTCTSCITDARFRTILLWPGVVAGSCLIDGVQRENLIRSIQAAGFDMENLFQLCNLLQLVWNDDDPRAYGPYGLCLMMERYNKHIPIS